VFYAEIAKGLALFAALLTKKATLITSQLDAFGLQTWYFKILKSSKTPHRQ
jgi:hypothetical protein